MSANDWYVEGVEFGGCNCAFGCPCQFEALPTEGHCRGFEVLRIDKGHHGDVTLDGLTVALVYAWPGAVFQGGGEMQAIISEQADQRQREALVRIVHGEDTEEAATHWWVYHAMCDKVHDPLFSPIEFEVDMESRTARVSIPGVLESEGRPIRSPATGSEHRARIDIPSGIEFELAEMGSTVARATGAITLDLNNTYGQFNALRHSGRGVVRS
jgi:hypothetical protein